MDLKSLLFSFQGRINRQPFWLAIWGAFFSAIVIMVLARFALPVGLQAIATTVIALALLWVGLALSVKRAHDLDRGWGLVALSYAPNIALYAFQAIRAFAPEHRLAELLILLTGFVVGLMPVVKLLFFRGTQGSNQFGSNPLSA